MVSSKQHNLPKMPDIQPVANQSPTNIEFVYQKVHQFEENL